MATDYEFVRKAMPLVRVPDKTYQVLFQEIGKTLWSIQYFEDALAKYLTAVFKIPHKTAAERAWTILEKSRKDTAGSLLKQLRVNANLPEKADEMLSHIVDERNWFVHRLQHENAHDLYSDIGFTRLIQRIRNLHDNALRAQKEFARLLAEEMNKLGATDEQIDQETLKVLSAFRNKR